MPPHEIVKIGISMVTGRKTLQISDYGYVIERGRIVLAGYGRELLENKELKQAYMGI